MDGIHPASPTFDTVGFLSRSITDIQLVCHELGVMDNAEPSSLPAKLNIGFVATDCFDPLTSTGLRRVWNEAHQRLSDNGVTISDVNLGPEFDGLAGMKGRLTDLIVSDLAVHFRKDRAIGRLTNMNEELIESAVPGGDVVEIRDELSRLRPIFDTIARRFDALITPSVEGEAPLVGSDDFDYNLVTLWTGLHVPMINIPGLVGESGLPVGLSVLGAR